MPHPLIERGRQAAKAGDFAGAGRAADQRLREAPADIDALELRALVQAQSGDTPGAIATLRQALMIDPKAAWAHGDLVLLLHQSDKEAAFSAAHAALDVLPDDANIHSFLGAMRSEADDLPGGEHHLRRALTLAGPHRQILLNLAINLLRQGRIEEADAIFAEADAAYPNDADLIAHWARLAEARGDFALALQRLDRAERLGRDVSLQRAITLGRKGEPSAALALIDAAPNPGGDALLERGRLLDRLERFDEAWAAFVVGKAKLAARDGAHYDAAAVRTRFAEVRHGWTADMLAPNRGAPTLADVGQPIFILGFPRSGTTMLEQMLTSHSAIRAGGELPFVTELDALAARAFGAAYPSRLVTLTTLEAQAFAIELRDHYLARATQYGLQSRKRFFTDKMPLNEAWLPLIRLAFPQAPLIRMQRHPLDVCVSMMAHHMTHGFQCGYRLEDIAAHMLATEDLLAHYVKIGIADFTMRYETLVQNQEGETRRLFDHLGLSFEPACLRFHENPRHAPTPSYAQVTAPLNDRSIGRWKNYAAALAPVMPQLAPLLARLGYLL
ncbi:MAG: sulfotransferase [Pseudomonadota bacterium]